MATDVIVREEILAAIAIRAGELRLLRQMMESCEDFVVMVRLDAKLGELEWLAETVVRWDSGALVVKGDGDGE